MMSRCAPLVAASILLACGGGQEPPQTAESESSQTAAREAPGPAGDGDGEGEEAEAAQEEETQSAGVPKDCASRSDDVCLPPKGFVSRLCQDVYPNIALVMFRGGTPWTRVYLTRKTEAWNAAGGASISGWLEFDEEVLVLKHRKAAKGGMQVSGAGGGYEALRWNGACVTLSGEEVTLRKPPKPKVAKIEWKYIDDTMREALKEDATVRDAYIAYRKECKGVTMGSVSKKCVVADARLSDVIAEFVSGGGKLSEPEKLPD